MRSLLRAPSAPHVRSVAAIGAFLLVLSGVAVGPALAHDSAAGTPAATITIRAGLSDRDVRVRVGDIVRFVNRDDERHRLRARSGPREFDTGDIEPGQSYQVRLAVVGTYAYLDERNDDSSAYRGRIVVGSSGGGSDSASASGGSSATTGGSSAGRTTAKTATLTIGDDFYQPTSLRVAVGGAVTFRNAGRDQHSATSAAFNTGALRSGASVRKTFKTAGTYDFLCMFHSDMRGTIRVVAASSEPPAPARVAPQPRPTPIATATPVPDGAGSADDAEMTASVDIADFSFGSGLVDVAAGGSVAWTNTGVAPHTVTAKDGSFTSGMLQTNDTFRQTFTRPGTYAYVCAVHPDMAGTVRVLATAGVTSASGAAAAVTTPIGAPSPTPPMATRPTATPRIAATRGPASNDAPTSAAATDVSALGGIALSITLVSAAAALFSRVIRGTVRVEE